MSGVRDGTSASSGISKQPLRTGALSEMRVLLNFSTEVLHLFLLNRPSPGERKLTMHRHVPGKCWQQSWEDLEECFEVCDSASY